MSTSEMQSLMKMGREDDTTMVNVSVAIWFTKEFAAIENDVQGYGLCGQSCSQIRIRECSIVNKVLRTPIYIYWLSLTPLI